MQIEKLIDKEEEAADVVGLEVREVEEAVGEHTVEKREEIGPEEETIITTTDAQRDGDNLIINYINV